MGANSIIQVRRGVYADWSGINPTLKGGEIGYETDTKQGKIGDGSTSYLSLPYVIGTGVLGGGAGTVTDAFKFIQVTGGPIITASGSGDTLNVTGIAPLNILANTGTNTLTFNVSNLGTGDVAGFQDGVENIVATELLGEEGIQLTYNAIDDVLSIKTSGVPLFETDNSLVLPDALTVQGSAVIQGNLTVQGSSIIANSTNVNIGDNIITVNVTDAVASGGIQVFRSGTTPSGYASMLWNENSDRFIFSTGVNATGSADIQANTFIGNLSGVVSGTVVGDVSGTATNARNVHVYSNNNGDDSNAILISPSVGTGDVRVASHTGLFYNAVSKTLTAPNFAGSLKGTGDVASEVTITTTSTDANFNIVLASGTGSPQGLFTDNSTLSFNPSNDTLTFGTLSGLVVTGSPSLSAGIPNASYKIQHFNINNCRVDGGSP